MRGLIIDTETTGLSHNFNQVLTVGMVLADIDEELNFLNSKHIRIKHETYNINPFAMRINKIDIKEHNKIGIEPKKACLEMNRFIKVNKIHDVPLIGHNIGFDMRFLRELYIKAEKEFMFDMETVDTRDLWKNLKNRGIVPMHLKGNLHSLADHFEVDYSSAHDAIGDCMITANVFHKIIGVMRQKEII